MRYHLLVLLIILVLGCSRAEPEAYLGVLESPGGPILFQFYMDADLEYAYVVNVRDTLHFSAISTESDSIILSFQNFDSHLKASLKPDGIMNGRWYKTASEGSTQSLPFRAEPGFMPKQATKNLRFDGEWRAEFEDEDGSFPATGVFKFTSGNLRGTFLTETGDYRFLEGFANADTLILSTFDGAHAFFFRATLNDNGQLNGKFWSSDHYVATWSAVKGESELRDPSSITKVLGNPPGLSFQFPDTKGNLVTEKQFKGRPVLLYVFGSWCPNCADEARMLRGLWEEYKETGLKVVGVAFEYTGDFKRDAEMVERYRDRFDIPWTLLIGGISDKNEAASKLPFVQEIVSFPTSFFADQDHIIQFTHTGFMGPGTGTYYDLEIERFRHHIDEIIK